MYCRIKQIPNVDVFAEAPWYNPNYEHEHTPDLVVVSNNEVTDIFELKYFKCIEPITRVREKVRIDVEKLIKYASARSGDDQFLRVDPMTIRVGGPPPITSRSAKISVHFVVICLDAKEIYTELISRVRRNNISTEMSRLQYFYHWHGQYKDNGIVDFTCNRMN